MASRRQTCPGPTVHAQERKKDDAPNPIRRSITTVPQPTAPRSLVNNAKNGRAPLENRMEPAVVEADKCVRAVAHAAARSRQALMDVGNVINCHPAEANRKKVVHVAAHKQGKAIKPKESNKPKPEATIISSYSGKENKGSGEKRASRQARIQTLTSILTKCSRTSDGIIPSPSKMQEYDIDAHDALNELAVVEYVDDIYSFYKNIESTCLPLSSYMATQTQINERMRAILIDWIIDVQQRLKLMPECLYLTVYIIDQYLSDVNVPKKELQLVGISAMLIACKYEEIRAPMVRDLLCLSDNDFSREQALRTEKAILNQLQWNLTVPTMYMFIVRYLKAAMGNKELENMTFFYAELSLVQYSMLVYRPSLTAAAAIYAARCTLNIKPLWSDILVHHTDLAESELKGCARQLVKFHSAAPQSKQKAVYRKYSNRRLGAVSLLSPAKKLLTASTSG